MILRVADDHHATAIGSYHIALGNGLLGVVRAFGVDVWTNGAKQCFDGRLCEDGHEIDGAQGGNNFGSLAFGIAPTDPRVLSASAVLLALVAVAATIVPARRATRVDPALALREE